MKNVVTIVVFAALLITCACSPSGVRTRTDAKSGTHGTALRQPVMVDGAGFHPSEIRARAGQKLTLVFHRVTDSTCAKRVVFKDLGLVWDLPLHQELEVSVIATEAPIEFACGMGMLRGTVVALRP